MKGHERDPRWSRRRRDTCILWSLGLGALITLLWLTVFVTLLVTTGDQVFRRRYPRLAPHPFALVFGADGASALAHAPRRRTWTASSGSRPRLIYTSGCRCGGAFRRIDNRSPYKQLVARVPVRHDSPEELVRKRRREEERDLARRLSARPHFLSCATARD